MKGAKWPVTKLESVAKIQTGISKSTNRELKEPAELPYLRVANVQDGHLLLDEIKTIQLEWSKVSRYSLKKGDVLLTEGGDFEYVMMRELCHLRHHDHGLEFYQLLARLDKKKAQIGNGFGLVATVQYSENYRLESSARNRYVS